MSKPLVSVWCSTYNHQRYIAQAIEGFVMQQTNFEIEIFIHDDASTDNTANIIREYASKYPQIKAIYQIKNKFSAEMGYLNKIMFQKAQGKYIAMCEGDDYWTDPMKLQKQVNFLESNSDFSICFHDISILHKDNSFEPHLHSNKQPDVTTFEDLAEINYIPTVSCVFRNNLFKEFPIWFNDMPLGDWILHLLNAQFGKIKYFNEVMAVYRVHDTGLWNRQTEERKYFNWIKVMKKCREHFYPRGKTHFSKGLANSYATLCFLTLEDGDYKKFRQYYRESLEFIRFHNPRVFLALTLRYTLSWFPALLPIYKNTAKKIKNIGDA
jgi:glycosyltransferase involved in cell wall biosynthesis